MGGSSRPRHRTSSLQGSSGPPRRPARSPAPVPPPSAAPPTAPPRPVHSPARRPVPGFCAPRLTPLRHGPLGVTFLRPPPPLAIFFPFLSLRCITESENCPSQEHLASCSRAHATRVAQTSSCYKSFTGWALPRRHQTSVWFPLGNFSCRSASAAAPTKGQGKGHFLPHDIAGLRRVPSALCGTTPTVFLRLLSGGT